MRNVLFSSIVSAGLALTLSTAAIAADTSNNGSVSVQGTNVKLIPATETGLPKDAVPGVKFVTTAQMKQSKGPTESGVFIVDSETIPKNLQANLKSAGYSLGADGKAVDAKGTPIAVYVRSATFQLAGGKKQGALPSPWERFAQAIANFPVATAKAGTPYPFRCFTDDLYAAYDLGGFCRWQRVHTFAEANGALADGSCGVARPETRITSVSVRAGFLPRNIARRSCTNCSRASVSREVHYGCVWPGIGNTPTMRHQVNMFDAADGARLDYVVDWHL